MAEKGRIDILVCNAGIARSEIAAEDATDEDWLDVIDVNLNGVFWCCRAFGRPMLAAGRGSIVNIGSMSGIIVNKPQAQANYNASKAGVHHLTKSLAAEWGARGVRVNAVAPTYVNTPLTARAKANKAMFDIWMEGTPMARMGEPDEIAAVVLFPRLRRREPDDRLDRAGRRRLHLLVKGGIMDLGLKNKVAVVTGGSVGIGLAIAEGLAAEGVDLALAARGAERLRDEATRIAGEYGVRAEGGRLRRRDPRGDGRADRRRRGRPSAAPTFSSTTPGTGSNETVMEAPDEKWQAYWDLHVMAAVRLARGLAPLMKARGGGVILHNASICAVQPLWYEPIYNTTKAALMMFSKCLADRTRRRQHPRQLRQSGPHPDARLDQDRQAADGGQGRRLAGLPRQRRARARADQALRHASGAARISSSSCAPSAPAIRWARPISSTAAC